MNKKKKLDINLLDTSVDISIDLDLDLNLLRAANLLFCVICPCNGMASNPKFLSNKATRIVLLQVAINTINELPAISFSMCTKYTSCKNCMLTYIYNVARK